MTGRVTTQRRREARAISLLGFLACLSGLTYLLDPGALQDTSVGKVLSGPLPIAWSILYAIGGLLVVVGTQTPQRLGGMRPEWESAGLWLLMTGLVVNGIAVVIFRGSVALAQVPALVYALWTAWGRVQDLNALRRIAVGRREDEDADRVGGGTSMVLIALPFVLPLASNVSTDQGVLALISGGLLAGIYNFLKLRREREGIIAAASEKATVSLERALEHAERREERLTERLAAAHTRIGELETRCFELERQLTGRGA